METIAEFRFDRPNGEPFKIAKGKHGMYHSLFQYPDNPPSKPDSLEVAVRLVLFKLWLNYISNNLIEPNAINDLWSFNDEKLPLSFNTLAGNIILLCSSKSICYFEMDPITGKIKLDGKVVPGSDAFKKDLDERAD